MPKKLRRATQSRKMKRNLLLLILLVFAFSELGTMNSTIMKASAAVSPYIAVVPESTVNATLTPGTNYTISIYTDYDGDDVTGYGFELTYNPNVLEGIEVVNGDLITEDVADTMFHSRGFNNTAGRLRYTRNGFYFFDEPAPLTSGPGTLANVTFRVIAKGASNITLEAQGGYRTRLIGYTEGGYGDFYNIIDSETMPDQIQHGYFDNRFQHDVAVRNVTAQAEATVESLVSISVEVANIGKSYEDVEVAISYNTTHIDSQNVTLAEGASETVLFSWNTTDLEQGTYTINATATIPGDGDLTDNWNTTTFVVVHDVAVVSVTAPAKAAVESLVSINVTVANEGSVAEVANVTVFYDSTLFGFNDTVVLPANSSAIVLFSWNASGLVEGNYVINGTATIPGDGDLSNNWNTATILLVAHDVAVVSVTAPAKAAVESLVSINVTVANEGSVAEVANVTVFYDSTLFGFNDTVVLPLGESETVLFSWNTTDLEQGTYTINATATIDDDGDPTDNWNTATIILVEHDVAVKNISLTSATATPGDIVSVNVTVSNIGAYNEVANVTVFYDSTLFGFNDTVVLPANSSAIVLFSWNTTGIAQGIHTINATATIDDDGDPTDNWNTATILLAMHDVAVEHILAPSSVDAGELVTIRVTVTNLGWYDETFEVAVTYDTSPIEDPKSVALPSGNMTYIEFSWNTTGVAPDSYTITAKAILGTDDDSTNNLETKSIVVNLPPGAIDGTVTRASTGQPIAGATVTADGYSATTDSTGYYSITDVPVGTYNITAEATGYYSNSTSATVFAGSTTTVDFTLMPLPGAIDGRVTNALNGHPILGANVTVTPGDHTVTTDIYGYYEVTDVPVGTYNITAEATGYYSDFKQATVESERTSRVNFALRVISTIIMSVEPATITVGKSTTISGSITPALLGVNVTIQYRLSPGEVWTNLNTVTTNEYSQYSFQWTPETADTFEVKALWPGDENTSPAESDVQTITVQEPPSSTPWNLYTVAMVAAGVIVIIMAAAFYFLRIRKPKTK